MTESAFTSCLEEYGDLLNYAIADVPDILLDYVSANTIVSCLHTVLNVHGAYSHKQAVVVIDFMLTKFVARHPTEQANVARMFACFVLGASAANLSALSKKISKTKLGKNRLGAMVASFSNAMKKSDPAYEFVKHQAHNLGDLDFWLAMVNSTTQVERIVSLLVVGSAVSLTKDATQIEMASSLFTTLMCVYNDDKDILYKTSLPSDFAHSDGLCSSSVFKQLKNLESMTAELETNLVQLVLLTMTKTLGTIDSMDWYSDVPSTGRNLLTGLFNLFVGGSALGCFENMLTTLISTHLKDNLLSFLVYQWTNKGNNACKMGSFCLQSHSHLSYHRCLRSCQSTISPNWRHLYSILCHSTGYQRFPTPCPFVTSFFDR